MNIIRLCEEVNKKGVATKLKIRLIKNYKTYSFIQNNKKSLRCSGKGLFSLFNSDNNKHLLLLDSENISIRNIYTLLKGFYSFKGNILLKAILINYNVKKK